MRELPSLVTGLRPARRASQRTPLVPAVALAVALALGLAGCTSTAATSGDPTRDEPSAGAAEPDPAGGGPEAGPSGRPREMPLLGTAADELPATEVAIGTGEHEVALVVRVAADAPARRRGLMGVEHLPEGTGMLFLFDAPRTGGFWMRDTLVPLDIAFADAEGRIVAVMAMQPCASDPCEVHDPGLAHVAALEVPAGWLASAGVGVGDELRWGEPLDVAGG